MSLGDMVTAWNTTAEERAAAYPCDRRMGALPYRSVWRAVDVAAPADIVFRWVCQLKAAPYSYDWIDNWGRRSPQYLIPGLEKLAIGERFLIGEIVELTLGCEVTVVIDARLERSFGFTALTYRAYSTGPASSRLVVKINLAGGGLWAQVRATALAWGDLIMMRKQLLTLKALAERSAHGVDSGSAE